jgi:hypothetical protein
MDVIFIVNQARTLMSKYIITNARFMMARALRARRKRSRIRAATVTILVIVALRSPLGKIRERVKYIISKQIQLLSCSPTGGSAAAIALTLQKSSSARH